MSVRLIMVCYVALFLHNHFLSSHTLWRGEAGVGGIALFLLEDDHSGGWLCTPHIVGLHLFSLARRNEQFHGGMFRGIM